MRESKKKNYSRSQLIKGKARILTSVTVWLLIYALNHYWIFHSTYYMSKLVKSWIQLRLWKLKNRLVRIPLFRIKFASLLQLFLFLRSRVFPTCVKQPEFPLSMIQPSQPQEVRPGALRGKGQVLFNEISPLEVKLPSLWCSTWVHLGITLP